MAWRGFSGKPRRIKLDAALMDHDDKSTNMVMKILIAAALTLLPLPALAAKAPVVSTDQIAMPLPIPYDVAADADAQVAAAKAKARKEHKLLLIDLGGNWCLDCRVLAGAIEIPALHAFVAKNYEVVSVDIGRRDKNLQIPKHYGVDIRAVPALLVVDPKTDKLRNPGDYAALSDARNMAAQALSDWLAKWVK
jgi:thiol-disulfide isomerase/thioredoxin